MKSLPKKVRKVFSVNESLYRWYHYCLRELQSRKDIVSVIQRKKDGNFHRLPILKVTTDSSGTHILLGE
jgi:hypothetical protein